MGPGRLAAVADTGPLIHLAEIDCLTLLAIFTELHIPEGKAAKLLGLTPVGSLGIVARAHRMGRISRDAAERYLRDLHTVSSLFVTPTIVDLAIERLRS